MASKFSFEKKIKEFIKDLDERINHLIARGLDISDEDSGKYDSLLEKLLEQRKDLALKENGISELSEEKWRERRASIQHDFECLKDEVEVAYESIQSKNIHLKKKT